MLEGRKQLERKVERLAAKVLGFVLATMSLTVVGYLAVSSVFSTDLEKRLIRENRMYSRVYPLLQPKEEMLLDVVAGLQAKDDSIYGDVFHTKAPDMDPVSSLETLKGSGDIPETKLVSYTARKSDDLMASVQGIDEKFAGILRTVATPGFVAPPMHMPVSGITYSQVGASRGLRLNPFYKTMVQHDGIDFIAPQGSPVLAGADGVVTGVNHSLKGDGNTVTIAHKGGYETCYKHLAEISVGVGQSVSRGKRIGSVGMSGNSFAPHLHYEVRRDGVSLDPMGHVLASVQPEEYANMLFMAVNTVQSMD